MKQKKEPITNLTQAQEVCLQAFSDLAAGRITPAQAREAQKPANKVIKKAEKLLKEGKGAGIVPPGRLAIMD